MRALIGNELLTTDTETLDLSINNELPPPAQREAFRLLNICSLTVMIGYVLTMVSGTLFLATSPFRMKQHGWLLMSAILLYLFVPVEAVTLYHDWQMIRAEFFQKEELTRVQELFLARVAALQGAPTVASLCYYTIIALAVFQPFRKQ